MIILNRIGLFLIVALGITFTSIRVVLVEDEAEVEDVDTEVLDVDVVNEILVEVLELVLLVETEVLVEDEVLLVEIEVEVEIEVD